MYRLDDCGQFSWGSLWWWWWRCCLGCSGTGEPLSVGFDPVQLGSYPGFDAGRELLATLTRAPADHAHQRVVAAGLPAHQRPARVSLPCIGKILQIQFPCLPCRSPASGPTRWCRSCLRWCGRACGHSSRSYSLWWIWLSFLPCSTRGAGRHPAGRNLDQKIKKIPSKRLL